VLGEIAEMIDTALDKGWSVIKHNGALMRILKPALDIRGKPVADGLAAKAENQRREEAARADEQQKAQGQQGPAAPGTQMPQMIGTLTTAGPPTAPAGTAAPQPAQPTHKGHAKKTTT